MGNFKISFAETIPGLEIDGKPAPYPVLNERDVRAAAGIMLVAGIVAFIPALLFQNRLMLTIMVLLFSVEFFIRVVISPRFAPFYALGSLIVSRQRPEYSGAAQKRFAWSLGLAMAASMIFVLFALDVTRVVPLTICAICLTLLWLETAFGICVGCWMYGLLIKAGWIRKPDIMPACPGGACPIDFSKSQNKGN